MWDSTGAPLDLCFLTTWSLLQSTDWSEEPAPCHNPSDRAGALCRGARGYVPRALLTQLLLVHHRHTAPPAHGLPDPSRAGPMCGGRTI